MGSTVEIIIYIIGGLLAGIATGLVGLSAATIIAPLFATMLGMDPYIAIGIALASDVLASAVSSVNFAIHKNINLKRASVMGVSVILFVVLGSYLSKDMDPYNMNSILNIFVCVLGLRFIVYPVKDAGTKKMPFGTHQFAQSIFWGAVIGMISGYFGGGGGLSMLAVLTMLLGYKLKEAVGTSVFIMTFTALIGATVHIIIGGTFWMPLIITSVSALIGANTASLYANKIDNKKLNLTIGGFLICYGIALVLVHYI